MDRSARQTRRLYVGRDVGFGPPEDSASIWGGQGAIEPDDIRLQATYGIKDYLTVLATPGRGAVVEETGAEG